MISVYSDGGLLSANPSKIGGSAAWVHVDNGSKVHHGSEIIEVGAWGLERITNNVTELLAAVRGILACGEGEVIRFFTDSNVTRLRIQYPHAKMKGVPQELQELTALARQWVTFDQIELLGGHPSWNDLIRGHRADGLPVSKWNKWCDEECGRIMQQYRKRQPQAL